jgi:hypothetical protein
MPAGTVFNGAASVPGAYQQAPLAGVGQITTTATTSRQIQFAPKLILVKGAINRREFRV